MGAAYQWRSGGTTFPVHPQVVGRAIERLRSKDGVVAPGDLVELAKPPRSDLHELFEWDDAVAAHQHRISTARSVINSLVVEVTIEARNEPQQMRAFVNVTAQKGERGYVPLGVAMKTDSLRKQVLAQALNELQGWRRRYAQYHELSQMVKAIDDLQAAKVIG